MKNKLNKTEDEQATFIGTNGKPIPYGIYYLTSDDCPTCEEIAGSERCSYYYAAYYCPMCNAKPSGEKCPNADAAYYAYHYCPACESELSFKRYYRAVEKYSGIKLGDIHYVNLSHEENPTDVDLKTLPFFVEYNEQGRFVRGSNRIYCDGYPLINKDDGWEKWRFDEDTRKKMDENRRVRTKELIIEDIKAGSDSWEIYCRCFDKELVQECWKEVTGDTISFNEETKEVTCIDEETGDVIFTQGVLFCDDT